MVTTQPPSNFNPRFEIVSCFCSHEGNFLLLHRDNNVELEPGKWGTPGGKLEQGESIEAAMVRELSEETGLCLPESKISWYDTVYVRYSDYDFVYHMFHATLETLPEIIINEREHQAYTWATPEQALDMHLIEDMDACIKLFFKK